MWIWTIFFIMNINLTILIFVFMNFASCRDFYVGMFKKNDWLVAQDRLYKEKVPFKYMYAKYGRVFKCKITYFRVSDRLGYGPGPKVEIVRGGLNRIYLVLRLTSAYNAPISVNIYVGCANKSNIKADTRVNGTDGQSNNDVSGSQNPDMVTTTEGCTHNCTNSTDIAGNATTVVPTKKK